MELAKMAEELAKVAGLATPRVEEELDKVVGLDKVAGLATPRVEEELAKVVDMDQLEHSNYLLRNQHLQGSK